MSTPAKRVYAAKCPGCGHEVIIPAVPMAVCPVRSPLLFKHFTGYSATSPEGRKIIDGGEGPTIDAPAPQAQCDNCHKVFDVHEAGDENEASD